MNFAEVRSVADFSGNAVFFGSYELWFGFRSSNKQLAHLNPARLSVSQADNVAPSTVPPLTIIISAAAEAAAVATFPPSSATTLITLSTVFASSVAFGGACMVATALVLSGVFKRLNIGPAQLCFFGQCGMAVAFALMRLMWRNPKDLDAVSLITPLMILYGFMYVGTCFSQRFLSRAVHSSPLPPTGL